MSDIPPNSTSPPSPALPDVLVVEDSRIQAVLLQRSLQQAGYTPRVARNGADALAQIRERAPRLVVSDIDMPEMDGYELCTQLKADPRLRKIPVILLSRLSDPVDIIRGLHAGADNYVTKPYEPEYLLMRIEALLSTPLVDEDSQQQVGLEVSLGGEKYIVRSGRHQILNLLVSTFENAVEKNRELIQANEQLLLMKEQLELQNRDLQDLNAALSAANDKMRRDLKAAAVVQQSLLPTSLPETVGVRFAWRFRPCEELAGDFLNVFDLDEHHLGFYVVDVSGHGVASSLLSVTISRLLTPSRHLATLLAQWVPGSSQPQITPPAQVLERLNERFPMESAAGQYFTIAYGVLDRRTHQLRYVSAGHPPLVHQRPGEQADLVAAIGTPIGWEADSEYDEHVLQLQSGDRIWLYSDGVTEALSEQDHPFGLDGLQRSLVETIRYSLEDGVASLMQDVEAWSGQVGLLDDASILALEVEL